MLYYIVKYLVRFGISLYYKKVEIKGLENIPKDRPVLLACNHPNAFMDAMILSVFIPHRIYSLARSDAFNTSLKKRLLNYFYIMPIYRIQEGADQLHKNEEIFDKCFEILGNKKSILMFPEGLCIQERRLRKLKKGLARIVFGAEKKFNYTLQSCVVPVGINYTRPSRHSGNVFIDIAPPLEVSRYVDDYQQDPVKTITAFTGDLEKEMQKLLVIIKDRKDDRLMEYLEHLYPPKVNTAEAEYHNSKSLADKIEHLKETKHDIYISLKDQTQMLFSDLSVLGFDFSIFSDFNKYSKNRLLLEVIAGYPLYIIGKVLNYIPYRIPFLLTKKMVKSIEFFASVNFTFGLSIFLMYYLILAMISALVGTDILFFIVPGTGIMLGIYALRYQSIRSSYQMLINTKSKAFQELNLKKQSIQKLFEEYTG